MEYFLFNGQEQTGPFSSEELSQKLQAGDCTESTLVWHKGLQEWKQLGDIVLAPQTSETEFLQPVATSPAFPAFGGEKPISEANATGDSSAQIPIQQGAPPPLPASIPVNQTGSSTQKSTNGEREFEREASSFKAPVGSEFRRTCRRCGKVWHSLVSREQKIAQNSNLNNCMVATQCCNPGAMLQAKRNVEAGESEIARLKQCPNCQSTDYKETIVGRGE